MAQDPALLAGMLVAGAFILLFVAWPLGRVNAQGFTTTEGRFSLEQFRRYANPSYTCHYRLIFYDTMSMGTLLAFFGTASGPVRVCSQDESRKVVRRLTAPRTPP